MRYRHANTTNAPPRSLTMLCGPKTTEQFRISTTVVSYLTHCNVRIGKYRRLPSTANLYSTYATINAHKIPTGKHLKEFLRRWFVTAGGECTWLRICALAGFAVLNLHVLLPERYIFFLNIHPVAKDFKMRSIFYKFYVLLTVRPCIICFK